MNDRILQCSACVIGAYDLKYLLNDTYCNTDKMLGAVVTWGQPKLFHQFSVLFGLSLILGPCLSSMLIASAFTFKEETFHTIKSSDNVELGLCATSTPSVMTSALSKIDCARLCQSETSRRCDGFNYYDTTFKCDLYYYRPQQYDANVNNCQYYRRASNEPCFQEDETNHYPLVNATQCSFPYTLNGNLYYNCSLNASISISYSCLQYQCHLDNMTMANCVPPADYEVEVVNSTVSVPAGPDTFTLIVNGWIAFMWRKTGSGDGNWALNWADYVNGFGSNSSYLWLGLERLHQLTSSGNWRLRMEFCYNGTWVSLEYWKFAVGGSAGNYILHVDGFVGDTWDLVRSPGSPYSFTPQNSNGMPFTAKDNFSGNMCCIDQGNGAWWYSYCGSLFPTKPKPQILITSVLGAWRDVTDVHLMLKAR